MSHSLSFMCKAIVVVISKYECPHVGFSSMALLFTTSACQAVLRILGCRLKATIPFSMQSMAQYPGCITTLVHLGSQGTTTMVYVLVSAAQVHTVM